ncbi:MAG: hybrid sensor histidine kinase/response regulator [Syntrophobacterales bacterium]|jgi:signal transduction histidine kinase
MLTEEILIVNDGSLLLKMMGGLLENKGYHISLTESPEDALALLSTRHIVLVVIKLNGQQTDRMAVTHMVKELNGGTKLIIMGESAHLPAASFEVEADDYILLPCRSSEIWRRLVSILETVAPSQPAIPQKDLVHPLNRRVLNNLGLMFHDVRGHLTSITEDLETLDRRTHGRFGQEVDTIFQETFRKSRTLISMAEEFLYKFQNQDPVQWSTSLVDLREDVVAPILEEMKDDLHKHCITLDNRLSLLPPVKQIIRGDRVALKSVFRNLLRNAINYGDHGCTICIELDEGLHYFRLRVQNSGRPLSSKRRQRKFTGERKYEGNGQGAGLGLHLGREVLRSQGGDIFCESGQQGTNFIMTLPRA